MSALPSTSIPPGLVLIAGASSDSGIAVAKRLADAGTQVIAVGSSLERLKPVTAVARYECDLLEPTAVDELSALVRTEHGRIDGLVHLVGGWRAGRSDEDWRWLHERVVETFRNTSRSFFDDLAGAERGRLVMVSSVAVDEPSWANANYSAAKAAAESWSRSAATEFAKSGAAASVILVVKSLGDGPGATPHSTLAEAVLKLWNAPSASVNGARIRLTT